MQAVYCHYFILQGSVVTQTMLGGQTIPKLLIFYSVGLACNQKL